MFGKRTTTRDVARQSQTQTRRSQADLDREIAAIDRQEKLLIAEIRKAAAKGQKPAVNTLTRQLIRMRKTREQLCTTKAQVTATHYRTQTATATDAMTRSMASSTRAMARVNAVQQPQKVAATMRQYEMERERMGTTQEMMDDMFEGDAEEEDEADAVVDQIFDEIGVEIGSKMADVPRTRVAAEETAAPRRARVKTTGDAELDKLLAQL